MAYPNPSLTSGAHPVQQRNAASEAVLGLANGVVIGALAAGAGSALLTATREGPRLIFSKMFSTHLVPGLGVAAGVGVVNALVRHGQAAPYNRWADAYNAQLAEEGHAARLDARSQHGVNEAGRG